MNPAEKLLKLIQFRIYSELFSNLESNAHLTVVQFPVLMTHMSISFLTLMFVQFLSSMKHSAELISNYFPCLEQAVWVLGNIAFDSPCYSDLILNEHALLPLLSLLNPPSPILSMLRITTWTLSNLVRGKPPVTLEQVGDISFHKILLL